ncbi:MAG: DNA polymerase III subunit delta' [Pseudohongiellaceae bacterium]
MTRFTESGIPHPWQLSQWQRLLTQWHRQRLAHAYLVCGESGLGKEALVRAFCDLLFCESPQSDHACGLCHSCIVAAGGQHPDLRIVKSEEGSKVLKIDQIRELAMFAEKTPHTATRKVVILSQAERLHPAGANALLKTLEEPPGDTVIFLLTDKPGSLLPTIRSRCQRLLFARPDIDVSRQWLQQASGVDSVDAAIAAAAGQPLPALALLQGEENGQQGEILDAFDGLLRREVSPVALAEKYRKEHSVLVVEQLALASSILLKYLLTGREGLLIGPRMHSLADWFATRRSLVLLRKLSELHDESQIARDQLERFTPNSQLLLESLFHRWATLGKL